MRHTARLVEQHGECLLAQALRPKGFSCHDVHRILPGLQSRQLSHTPSRKDVYMRLVTAESQLRTIKDPHNIIMYDPLKQIFTRPYEGKIEPPKRNISANSTPETQKDSVRAYIAIGSNLGKRMRWIERALRELKSRGIIIKRTSSLWETEPMYVTDQNRFLNGVIEIETMLEPTPLLRLLQDVENILGRHKIQDKGPRNIDLDILLYDNITYQTDELIIPHALMLEREFVLRPLAELIPNKHNFYPNRHETAAELLAALPAAASPMYAITSLESYEGHRSFLTPQRPDKKTRIMAILNATPDSFSDGGKYLESYDLSQPDSTAHNSPGISSSSPTESPPRSPTSQLRYEGINKVINYSAAPGRPLSIIDVGGQSTAPGAPEVTVEEETARVVPAIEHIKSAPITRLVSIDTYRASVAKAALNAGADIVNDVSAGTLDPEMLSTVAEAGCPYILMHMRGTPATMNKLTSYPNGLIPTIATELLERVEAAEAAGIYRWRILLDPGIGFAKNAQQNLEILRNFNQLRNWPGLENFPWLVASSRKGFIGKITGMEEPWQRGMGSMVAVAAAIQGGADIVRVHDLKIAAQTVKMADAIWRGWDPKEKKVTAKELERATQEETGSTSVS